jgi:hypothetical protein
VVRMMGRLLAAAAVSCAICAWVAAAAERWYVGHVGPEICVPLDDLDDSMQRLYYGGGQMHTPADFVAHFAAMGVTIKPVSGTPPGIMLYRGDDGSDMVLFNDPDVCKSVLAKVPQ